MVGWDLRGWGRVCRGSSWLLLGEQLRAVLGESTSQPEGFKGVHLVACTLCDWVAWMSLLVQSGFVGLPSWGECPRVPNHTLGGVPWGCMLVA